MMLHYAESVWYSWTRTKVSSFVSFISIFKMTEWLDSYQRKQYGGKPLSKLKENEKEEDEIDEMDE